MKDKTKIKNDKRLRRKKHIRKGVLGTPQRPRLVVYRSAKHIYAQLVDDTKSRTLMTVSTLNKDLADEIKSADGKIAKSRIVGKKIGEMAKKKKISKVVFDRSGYLYHGRVKAVADGAREGGLEF